MDIKSLKPAGSLAQFYGVKVLAFGGPGSGKTPVSNTAPNPVMMCVEPGMLSMRGSNIPAFEAYTAVKIREFFKWFFESAETKKFDTLVIDSVSQYCEIILEDTLRVHKHGLKAYGEMAEEIMININKLYYFPQKHLYLIAKQTTVDESGAQKRKPYFPGKELNVKIPHLFDEILHLGNHTIPGVIGQQKAFCTSEQFDVFARDRSGKLATFEPPNLTDIFNKAMS